MSASCSTGLLSPVSRGQAGWIGRPPLLPIGTCCTGGPGFP